jgi:hypothetical protein
LNGHKLAKGNLEGDCIYQGKAAGMNRIKNLINTLEE